MQTNEPFPVKNSRGKVRVAGSKNLNQFLAYSSPNFIDFIEKCLEWDPKKRITPIEALQHDWIIEGLPPEVLVYHKKMLGINTSEESLSTSTFGH
jgi:dual specificity tyrosine-phosphorylation-regulated kinase 2/3/4